MEWEDCGPPSSTLRCGFCYFGEFFSVVLGCPGLFLNVLLICMTAGGLLVGQGVLRCEKYLHASFGVYGGKRMIETLRTRRGLWEKLFLCSLKCCIFRQRRMCLLCQLVLVTFLFVLLHGSLFILLVYLGAHFAFNEIDLLLIKKKYQFLKGHDALFQIFRAYSDFSKDDRNSYKDSSMSFSLEEN
jgi:hypothetical protein